MAFAVGGPQEDERIGAGEGRRVEDVGVRLAARVHQHVLVRVSYLEWIGHGKSFLQGDNTARRGRGSAGRARQRAKTRAGPRHIAHHLVNFGFECKGENGYPSTTFRVLARKRHSSQQRKEDRMRIDLHMHSTYSDGINPPAGLVQLALEKRLGAISLTDHDCLDGVHEAIEAGRAAGVEVLSGVELSCEFKGRDLHILGYGVDPAHREFQDMLRKFRETRHNRGLKIIEKLNALGRRHRSGGRRPQERRGRAREAAHRGGADGQGDRVDPGGSVREIHRRGRPRLRPEVQDDAVGGHPLHPNGRRARVHRAPGDLSGERRGAPRAPGRRVRRDRDPSSQTHARHRAASRNDRAGTGAPHLGRFRFPRLHRKGHAASARSTSPTRSSRQSNGAWAGRPDAPSGSATGPRGSRRTT